MLGQLEMDVDECIAAYTKLMRMIFKKSSKRKLIADLLGKIESQVGPKKLELAIQEVITSHGANSTDLCNDRVDHGCRV